jgi:hypothetical protein
VIAEILALRDHAFSNCHDGLKWHNTCAFIKNFVTRQFEKYEGNFVFQIDL